MKLASMIKGCLLGLSIAIWPTAYAVPNAVESKPAVEQHATRAVNINSADATTMADALPGIGLKKAQAIVAYRTENGGFKSVDDLVNVKGIGAATLEKLRPQIAL